jgi:hypothetical protein
MLDGMRIGEVAQSLRLPVHAVNLDDFARLLLHKN